MFIQNHSIPSVNLLSFYSQKV
ncbi:hypothetical protein LINPERHAP2_LOCUS25268 [Linum perenne]